MPALNRGGAHSPCFAALPLNSVALQPLPEVRPLYWWARALQQEGCLLQAVSYSPNEPAAVVTVRLPSHRVVHVRCAGDDPAEHTDLPSVLAAAICQLHSGDWADDTNRMLALLQNLRLLIEPRPAARNSAHISGLISQPARSVRVAYWWAEALQARGWRLSALGHPMARSGFIAEIPEGPGQFVLAIYPRDIPDDGTEASALANSLQRLTFEQRRYLARLVSQRG
ncbi:hypothetical protein ACNO8X_18920 [Mycobacterium sp. PDNC021]|uniref:hypothetical protein n=1 Tax=Mycobacterium sp. PDNC021 TaxID=3391399 RepID=UPI003AAF1855